MSKMNKKNVDRQIQDRTIAPSDQATMFSADQYRSLALALERAEPRGKRRVVVVTSALAGEGKTLTVTNLALTLSDSFHRRVLLVDGDLRRPGLRQILSARNAQAPETPKNETLPEDLNLGLTLSQLSSTLFVLAPLEDSILDPVGTLNSPGMQTMFDWAREHFDWVLVDSPPALVPDANILAQLADGVIFVVWTASTPYEAARMATTNIGRDRLLGVVMNRVPKGVADGALSYYEAAQSGRNRLQ
jgi:protein-tyrosine kinase